MLRQWVADTASAKQTGKAQDFEDVEGVEDTEDEENEDRVPTKLIFPLEHACTSADLGFAGLQGRADAATAGVLVAASAGAGCELHLAVLSIEESGSAEYTESYGSRRGRWREEPELEVGEVIERYEYLSTRGGPTITRSRWATSRSTKEKFVCRTPSTT